MKNNGFLNGKEFQNYALCNEFMVFAICEKVEKSMPKWFPKYMKNNLKIDAEAAGGHLFLILCILESGPKNMNF